MERATADTMAEINEEVSYALHNMGVLLSDRGNLGKAEQMYQRALEGYDKTLGPDRILSYVPALNNAYSYGVLFEDQGSLIDAKFMYTRALRGYKLVFGTDYHWYQAAQDRLRNLETSDDSPSTSPTAAAPLRRHITDILPVAGSAASTTSKRLAFLRKLKLKKSHAHVQ